MTKEELKTRYLEVAKNIESLGVSVEKCFEKFMEYLLIPIEKIEKLYLYDFIENENDDFISCCFDMETDICCYRMCYNVKRNKKRKLTKPFVNAIRSFNDWGGEITYQETKCEYDGEQIFVFQVDGTKQNIFDALFYMRDYIMETMVGCACDWGDGNVHKWEDYTKYIMPILRAIDLCEKEGTIFDVIEEEE